MSVPGSQPRIPAPVSVTVTLEPHGTGETLMTIHHALLPPGVAGDHERGWAAIAARLAGHLRAQP